MFISFCRNFNLLSFGEEAEEDEEESAILNKQFSGKGKSAHDHLSDPKLSAQSAVEAAEPPSKKKKEDGGSDWESDEGEKNPGELETTTKGEGVSILYSIRFHLKGRISN